MNVKAVIIDDEQHAIDALMDVLELFGSVEVVETFTNPYTALERLQDLECQAVFLDIDMPGMNGLELADAILSRDGDMEIVFVTAYDKYAVEAFETNALDYLLKPVRPERMAKTLDRLTARLGAEAGSAGSGGGKIACFGQFQVKAGPEPGEPVKWRTQKAKELLAYLVHHRGTDVHKTKIVADVWPEMEEERAISYMHSCVYQIRKAIRAAGLQQRMNIVFAHDCYRLETKDIPIERDEFLRLAADAGAIGPGNIEACELAARLYRGHYLEENDYPWAEPARQELMLVYQDLVLRMADHYLEQGKFSSAIVHLRRVLAVSPYLDAAHGKLMRAYADSGDVVSLDGHYREVARMYREELMLEPGPAIAEWYERLRGRTDERNGRKE